MSNDLVDFYDQLAPDYHLIFADWKSSVLYQAEVLNKLIQAETGRPGLSILDCSCGIGTQAIGLALNGYTVHATDLSQAAVKRAAREAKAFNVSLTTGVADFRDLAAQVEGSFDVVITCDNSLPHLLTTEDMRRAAQNIGAKLKPGGLLLLSIRDYDQDIQDKPHSTRPSVVDSLEGRRIIFQVWDWLPGGNIYLLNHFIIKQNTAGEWQTACRTTHYRAWQRAEISEVFNQTGFLNIAWHFPEQTGYYQPILTAHKPL
jgi:methylase of polypeptide subunit release factors